MIVLPRSVLRADNTVLVANSEHKLEIRPVEVLRAEPETVYIKSGVKSGEQVITSAMDIPVPGTLLTLGDRTGATEASPDGEQP